MITSSLRLAVLALGLCASTRARAEADAEPIRVELEAAPSCANSSAFLRAVRTRTNKVRAATAGELARTFHVRIVPSADAQLSGDFSITEAGSDEHASDKRSIVGESCQEVFEALTLFAALAVDPQALTTPAVNAPAVPIKPAAPERAPRVLPSSATSPAVPANKPEHTPFQAGVGCDIGAQGAGTGAALLLLEPFAEARFAHTSAPLAVVPTVRLGFSSFSSETASTLDGPARLRWTTLRLDGCPAQLGLVGTLAARPCLALGGGTLKASGETIAHPESHTLGWWTLGALFRLEWSASRVLSFEASTALDAPVRRNAFYFEPESPETRVYRTPALLGRGEVGIGLHFL